MPMKFLLHSGVHHKKADCDSNVVIQKVGNIDDTSTTKSINETNNFFNLLLQKCYRCNDLKSCDIGLSYLLCQVKTILKTAKNYLFPPR